MFGDWNIYLKACISYRIRTLQRSWVETTQLMRNLNWFCTTLDIDPRSILQTMMFISSTCFWLASTSANIKIWTAIYFHSTQRLICWENRTSQGLAKLKFCQLIKIRAHNSFSRKDWPSYDIIFTNFSNLSGFFYLSKCLTL